MSQAAVRTSAAAVLAAAVAVRVSLSQPPSATLAGVVADPGGSLAAATSGWTTAGTLGAATAQGLRDLPLTLVALAGNAVSLPIEAVQAVWFVLVTLLALLGALRLAAHTAGHPADPRTGPQGGASWAATHVGALVYACGPVLLAALSRSPGDGLVAATLPWIVTPLLTGAKGWGPAAASAAWLGLVGFGSPHWAVAALVAGAVAAVLGGSSRGQVVRWLVLSCVCSAWWVAALTWELSHGTDVAPLLRDSSTTDLVRDAVDGSGWSTGWVVAALLGPPAVVAAAVLLKVGGRARRFAAGLLVVAVVASAASIAGPDVPVPAAAAGDGWPNLLAPVLAWTALAGLVAWAPLIASLQDSHASRLVLPRTVQQAVPLGVAVGVSLGSFLGFALGAHERIDPSPTTTELWGQVAEWSADAPPGRVLVLPAVDGRLEPVVAGALAGRPWIARDSVPLSGAAATIAIDDAVRRMARGLGGDGTTAALDRLGISYVIVRNDLPVEADRTRPAAFLRQALTTQGASRIATFSDGAADMSWLPDGTVSDFGVRSSSQSLEIWSTGVGSGARMYDEAPLVVAGDAGTTTDLADAGLGGAPVTIAPADAPEVDVVSDSPRRRDVDQREALEPFGPYLTTAEDPLGQPPGAAPVPTATRRVTGVRSVTASSSAADLGAWPPRPGSDPEAALDGNPFTGWQSGSADPGEWWQVEFLAPTDLSGASLQLAQNPFTGTVVTRLRLEHDGGETEVDVPADGRISLAPVTGTTRLRVAATEFARGRPSAGFSITELSVPGLVVRDELVVDGPATQAWLLASRPGSRATCVPAAPDALEAEDVPGITVACNPALTVSGPDRGDISRLIENDESVAVRGRVWMRSTDSDATRDLVDRVAEPSIEVSASSVVTQDLSNRPQAAADGDLTTSWRPAPDDLAPTLTLRWDEPRRITGVRLVTSPGDPASTPTRVRVRPTAAESSGRDGWQDVEVRDDGTVALDPVRADQLTVTFLEDTGHISIDTLTAGLRQLPIAIAETEIIGGPAVSYDGDRVASMPCGGGPQVDVGRGRFDTSVTFSADDLVRGDVLSASVCGQPRVERGTTRVTVRASFRWTPLGLALSPVGGPLGAVDQVPSTAEHPEPLALEVGMPDSRTVDLPDVAAGGTLVAAVPAGQGWTARGDGELLRPVTVDGWAQGWSVPAQVDSVRLDYSPARSLRVLAATGLAAWLALLAFLALPALPSRGSKKRRDQAIAGRSTQS